MSFQPGLDVGNEDKIKRGSKKFPSFFIYFLLCPKMYLIFCRCQVVQALIPFSSLTHARVYTHIHARTRMRRERNKRQILVYEGNELCYSYLHLAVDLRKGN